MAIDSLRTKIYEMINKIEDESALNILMEDAAVYVTTKNTSTSNDLAANKTHHHSKLTLAI
jgi:hypothetical protein